jgi:hypothetical protein
MERRRALNWLARGTAAIAAASTGATTGNTLASPLSIGFIGDTPYHQAEALHLEKVLVDMSASNTEFCIHVGDFKSGLEVCSEHMMRQRLELLSRYKRALFLTPGDNEWLDCHRPSTGAWNPHERLDRLREIAYATDASIGSKPLPASSQRAKGFPENQRWEASAEGSPVVFATFNIPGSKDGWAGGSTTAHIQERHTANLEWLDATMALAKQRSAPIVVLAAHADIEWVHNGIYAPWIAHLGRVCRQFSGEILYLHGDSHRFAHDKPLYDKSGSIRNLTRVECYGSPFSQFWVQIDIRPSRIAVPAGPFTVTTRKIYA